MVATREQAYAGVARLQETCAPKYPSAIECPAKDKRALLVVYDFPAAHWKATLGVSRVLKGPDGTRRHYYRAE